MPALRDYLQNTTYLHLIAGRRQPGRGQARPDVLRRRLLRRAADLRATTRGRYAFPPARAEAMYIPELYGRSAGAVVDVN